MARAKIKRDFPIERTHCGLVTANGCFGASVFGEDVHTLNITVNRNDFWDRQFAKVLPEGISYRNAVEVAQATTDSKKIAAALSGSITSEGQYPSSLMPGGRFDFKLKDGVCLKSAELDCNDALITISVQRRCEVIKIQMGVDCDCLKIDDPGCLIAEIVARPAWDWIGEVLAARGLPERQIFDTAKDIGWLQETPTDEALCACCRKVGEAYAVVLSLGTDPEDARLNAEDSFKFMAQNGGDFYRKNAEWWANYWSNVPQISIPSEFFSLFTDYAQYKFACVTNPHGSKPCPLQGPWLEEYRMPSWGGDYTVNINIEQIYYLTFYGGNLNHILPLFDMLESDDFRKIMRQNAKRLLGIDDGLLLTHSVNDRGQQCQLTFSEHSSLDQMLGAWMAQLYWQYYQHTLDRDFLEQRAYPFMKGIMRVYEAMLTEGQDGFYHLELSVSPEYGVSGFAESSRQSGRDSSAQFAAIHMLLDIISKSSEILGREVCEKWLDIKRRTPLYTLIDDEKPRIAIWKGQDLAISHRHHSHLAGIYPFDCFGEMTGEKRRVIENSINHWLIKGTGLWSEWAFPWAAIIQARLGMKETPLILLDIWKEIFVNEGLATVYLPRFAGYTCHRRKDIGLDPKSNEFIQLDGTMGGATAIYEMLVHTHGGVTKVFPATPEKWDTLSFKNIRQPGPFAVSASKENGKIREICVKSLGGTRITLNAGSQRSFLLKTADGERKISLPRTFEFASGEKLHLQAL